MDVIQAQTVLREHAKQRAIAEMHDREGLVMNVSFYLHDVKTHLDVRLNANGTWEWA